MVSKRFSSFLTRTILTRFPTPISDEDDDDDDSMLTLKRKDHDLAGGEEKEEADSDSWETDENGETSKTFEQIKEEKQSAKVVTKASLAKKALKKNFQVNRV